MKKELIIESNPTKVEIALLEDSRLVEIHSQKTKANFSVGDIFLGRIKKTMPGLNAAFVDIGHRKDAFLHYTDLGPPLRSLLKYTDDSMNNKQADHRLDNFDMQPEIVKTGKIDKVLKRRQAILVQILKEPISTKGPRLTCELTLPGRYLVLTPFQDVVAVSKKIANADERKRLQVLIESIKPKKFGIIVRTAAEGKKVADLHDEISSLFEKWASIQEQLKVNQEPIKLLSELDKPTSILRDMLTDSFNKVVVDDKVLFNNVKSFLSKVAPEQAGIVSLHRSKRPIFETYGISKQIKSSFGKTATMPSGAYLVIESTEAMHVIDVNSGPKMQKQDQETVALKVNMEAAGEIARQMRLRDIGGIIIIDFIDMRKSDHRAMLLKQMKIKMKKDRAQHTILPLSKFGLMQITRQRERPEVTITTAEKCSACGGSGQVNPTILVTDEIIRDIEYIFSSRPLTNLSIHVHPYIEAFFKKGLPSMQHKMFWKRKKWIKIIPDFSYNLAQYIFHDGNGDEIRLN